MKMLLIDKDITTIAKIQHIFSNIGIEVHSAVNEHEALDVLDEFEFDVVFLDIDTIPNKHINLITKIRKINSVLEIILMVEQDNLEIALDAMNNGATDYLVKPISIKDLLKQAEDSCHKMRRYRQLIASTKEIHHH